MPMLNPTRSRPATNSLFGPSAPGAGQQSATPSLGLAAPAKKYPKIGQVTPGQGGLAVDPRMAAAGAYARANGITQPNYGPPANQGYQLQVNPNQPPAWGHEGAPADFHQWRAGEFAAGRNPATGRPSLGLAAPVPAAQTHGLYPGVDVPQAQHLEAQGGLAPPTSLGLAKPNPRQPMPSYAQRLKSGATPFDSAALGLRYDAASNRIAKAKEPLDAGPSLFSGLAAKGQAADQYNLAHPGYQSLGLAAPPEKNYRNMSDADRERIAARFPGGKFLPYGSEPNGAAGAMTKADADQIDATKVAGTQLGLAQSRRANGFEPSPGGMSPQEKYDMRQYDKRNAARQLTADRASGKAQTPRQTRMLARSAAQKEQFEQGLGLASPNAYTQLQGSRAQIAAANAARESNERIQMDRNKATRDVADITAGTAAGKRYMDAYTELVKGGMSHADILRRLGPPPGSTAPSTAASPASPSPTTPVPTPTPPTRVAGSASPTVPGTPAGTPVALPSPFHSPVAAAATPSVPLAPTPAPGSRPNPFHSPAAAPTTIAQRNRLGAQEHAKTFGKVPYQPKADLTDAQRAEISKAGSFSERERLMKQYGVISTGDKAYYHQTLGEPDQPALWGIPSALHTLYGSIGARTMASLGLAQPDLAAPTRRRALGGSIPASKSERAGAKRRAYVNEVEKGLFR